MREKERKTRQENKVSRRVLQSFQSLCFLLFGGIFFHLVELLGIHQLVECVCCNFVFFIGIDVVEVRLAVLFVVTIQINFAVFVLAVFIERQKGDVLFLVWSRENGQYGTFYFGIVVQCQGNSRLIQILAVAAAACAVSAAGCAVE